MCVPDQLTVPQFRRVQKGLEITIKLVPTSKRIHRLVYPHEHGGSCPLLTLKELLTTAYVISKRVPLTVYKKKEDVGDSEVLGVC